MENKSQVAGILSIVSGVFGLLYGALFIVMVAFMDVIFNMALETEPAPYWSRNHVGFYDIIYGAIGVVFILIGILSIVGGVYSIKRKYWGLGLAGAIAGTITFFPCGIAAIVIIALGKPEFDRPATVTPTVQSQPPIQS